MPILALPLRAASLESGSLELQVRDLRNGRGIVRVCVTRHSAHFPDCRDDASAYRLSIAASDAGTIRLNGIAPGTYAIALLHDENGHGRLDTFAGLPREGYGFSRDAPVRFGPPRFKEARIAIAAGENRQSIRIRYLL